MRDQVKVWLGNSDIKDKNPLLEARKSIESVSLAVYGPSRPSSELPCGCEVV